MAAESKAEDDLKQNDAEEKYSQYSLTIAVIKNALDMHLHDAKSKYMYHGSFTSKDLEECGFGNKQAANLENVCKFIESARKGFNGFEFSMRVEKNPNNQIDNGDIAVIKIVRNDEFFPMEIVLRLKQTPRQKIDILEEHIKDLKSDIEDLKIANKALSKKVVPKGSILMWSGSVDAIPNGWALCDGNNGTPNLKGKFILSTDNDQYNIGDTGGSDTHQHNVTVGDTTLTLNQIPSHAHHSQIHLFNQWSKSGGSDKFLLQNGSNCGSHTTYGTNSVGGGQPHSHSGTCSNVSNIPPYIVLGYIMKVV